MRPRVCRLMVSAANYTAEMGRVERKSRRHDVIYHNCCCREHMAILSQHDRQIAGPFILGFKAELCHVWGVCIFLSLPVWATTLNRTFSQKWHRKTLEASFLRV